MNRVSLALVLAAVAVAATGCAGYSMQPLHRTDVRTVYVPVFASKEFRRELEFDLTRDLVKTIETRTPYKVVGDPKRADTELRGEVLRMDAPVISENKFTDTPQDVSVSVSCWFEWKDLRTGQILTKHNYLTGTGTYAPAIGETHDSATAEAIRRLAERIVEKMEKPW